ncbi:MAG: gamma-glutamyltransferase [Chitinophagales bacterium]|nr:gamma-glutamyltransferase [Chitinophagales bacterium]
MQNRPSSAYFASRSEVIGINGMVASSHSLASAAGIEILKKGGSAVDAAIAANAVLAVVEPTGCGIGGDLFAICWIEGDKKLYGLNGSGRSSLLSDINQIKERGYSTIPKLGPLSITVPGCVDAWFELHNKFCNLEMEEILKPAIYLAENGFPLTEVITFYWNRNMAAFKEFPSAYALFGSEKRVKGERIKNESLAKTLSVIAKSGKDVFYQGDIARKISDFIVQSGGNFCEEDLNRHSSIWVDPLSINYRGYDIWELPPNGQGIAVLQMLNMLEEYNLADIKWNSAEYIHLLVEAKKLVYEDRAKYYSDPDFSDFDYNRLLTKSYAKERSQFIDLSVASKTVSAGSVSEGDTVYLSTADQWGNMVSFIQSNYMGMGSGIAPPGLGFMLQNRGCSFSLDKNHANCLESGKRPFHTIIPAFVSKEDKPMISFGLMGGDMQPQGHVQIISNIFDHGMNLQEAGDAPRVRHEGSSDPNGNLAVELGGTLFLEHGFSDDTIADLGRRGHNVKVQKGGYGGYQAIMKNQKQNVYYGASEYRKDGCALAY